MSTTLKIATLERGFVYIGRVSFADQVITITDAKCIRRWGTTRGLGQLALEGKTENTKLDPSGTVAAPLTALIHTIDCDETKWPEYADASDAAPAASEVAA